MAQHRLAIPVQIAACVLGMWGLGSIASFAQNDLQARANIQQTPGPSFVNTADPAFAGAQEVIVDVPNVFHWARFQRGGINGWRYALYPDGSATVNGVDNLQGNPFTLDCQSGVACQVTRPDGTRISVLAVGGPRPTKPENPDGNTVSLYLAEWILAGTGSPPVALTPPELPPLVMRTTSADPKQSDVLTKDATANKDTLGQSADIEAPPEPRGPTPLCSEPDPIMPSLCSDPPNEPVPALRAPAILDKASAKTIAAAPLKSQPALIPRAAPTPKTVLGRLGLNCSLTGSTSLGYAAAGSSNRSIGKPRLSLGCNAKLTETLSLRLALLKYLNAGEQTIDDPDFTYAFTYRYSDKLTFNYSNYSAQFGGANGGIWNALNDGTLRGSYKLPDITLPNQRQATCSASVRLPNPFNNSLNISCGYAVTDKLRIGGTLNLYRPSAQGDYDPDYTYTASYRVSDDFLVSYSNYSNNRWAWNRGKTAGPGLSGGSLSVTYGLKF